MDADFDFGDGPIRDYDVTGENVYPPLFEPPPATAKPFAIHSLPKPRSVMMMLPYNVSESDHGYVMVVHSPCPVPNLWIRFWYRVLLNIRFAPVKGGL